MFSVSICSQYINPFCFREKLKTPSCRSLLKRALKNVASRIKPVDDHNAEAQALLRFVVAYWLISLQQAANSISR